MLRCRQTSRRSRAAAARSRLKEATWEGFVAHFHQLNRRGSIEHVRQLAGQFNASWHRPLRSPECCCRRPAFLPVVDQGPQMGHIVEIPEAAGMFARTGMPKSASSVPVAITRWPRSGSALMPFSAFGVQVDRIGRDPANADAAPCNKLAIGGCHFPALQFTTQQFIEKGLEQTKRSLGSIKTTGRSGKRSFRPVPWTIRRIHHQPPPRRW